MIREIKGSDSKEFPSIKHFFDLETGLFSEEDPESKKSKLDKWLAGRKEFEIIEKEEQSKSSFGRKKDENDTETKKSRWGKSK